MQSTLETLVTPTLKTYSRHCPSLATPAPPLRSLPFNEEPGYHEPARVWLYGNTRLLGNNLFYLPEALGPADQDMEELDEIERQTEEQILASKFVVCGIHNPAHMRSALVPLRWGSPRILVLSGGFQYHLGEKLDQEPFRAARLWRYQWDPLSDLVISRRAPEKRPTFSLHNSTVDRMITQIVEAEWPGLRWIDNGYVRVLV